MKIYNYFGKEQKIYYDKLPCGLEVYVLPNKKHKNYHAELVTRYGSDISEFLPVNEEKYLKIPDGTAHFLEHKMFDMELSDAFNFFGKYGTYVNAATNYNSTRYYIDGKKNFKKNLDYLLTMVYTPYLKDELIENEKGIISEEIQMYDDEPEWILDYEIRKMLFKNIYKNKIAGTKESIKKINANLLTKVYDTFYQPSNMFLVVSGNISYQEVLKILNENVALSLRDSNHPIIYKSKKENKKIINEYKLIEENIVISKLKYSFKFDLDDYGYTDKTLLKMYLNIIFTILFGDGSFFNEEVLTQKMATSFYYEHLSRDNIYVFSIEAESEYADMFVDKVMNTLEKRDIKEEDFLRIKKVWYSIIIRSIDNIGNMADSMVYDILQKENNYDGYELINKLDYQELKKILSKMRFNNHSLVLMIPKKTNK